MFTREGRSNAYVIALRTLGLLSGVAAGLSLADLTASEAKAGALDTGCYDYICWPGNNAICHAHKPNPCENCFNHGGTYCGGPC